MCALAITLSKRGASVTGTASGARAYKMAMDTIWLLLLAVSVNVKSCGVIAAGPALPGSTVTLTCSSKPFSSGVVCIAPAGTMPTLLNTPATSARCIPAARAARQHRAGAAGNSSTSSSSGVAARRHVVRATADNKGKSVEELLAEANALLDQVSHGEYAGLQASIDELEDLGYTCDESGCVLILPEKPKRAQEPYMKKLLQGNSWNIGHPSEAPHPEYTAIVSGPFWTIPMRETELQEFVELLGQLRRVVQQLDGAGQWLPGSADRPASRIKWDSPHMSMQATYAPIKPYFAMDITFTTSGKRPITASWPATILSEICDALDKEAGLAKGAASKASPAAPIRPQAVSA